MASQPRLLGEFALIARYFALLAQSFPGAYGLLDDADRRLICLNAAAASMVFPPRRQTYRI